MRILGMTLATLTALALVGCGGGESGGGGSKITAACDMSAKMGSCTEFHSPRMTAERNKTECDGMGGVVVASCPTENAIGRCIMEEGKPGQKETVSYSPTLNAEAAKGACVGRFAP